VVRNKVKLKTGELKMKKLNEELPVDVKESDLKYPEHGKGLPYKQLQELGMDYGSLTFYKTTGLGWVLTTLHISNPSRRQAAGTAARSYGISVSDGKIVTVGRGPHVTKEIQVYLSQDNIDRMMKYVQLHQKGLADAGQIRDRISSRRAQGQLYRSAGRSSWTW
jgi:hypothetical protein